VRIVFSCIIAGSLFETTLWIIAKRDSQIFYVSFNYNKQAVWECQKNWISYYREGVFLFFERSEVLQNVQFGFSGVWSIKNFRIF